MNEKQTAQRHPDVEDAQTRVLACFSLPAPIVGRGDTRYRSPYRRMIPSRNVNYPGWEADRRMYALLAALDEGADAERERAICHFLAWLA